MSTSADEEGSHVMPKTGFISFARQRTGGMDGEDDKSRASGKAHTGLPITPYQMYMLDWEQIRRLARRCDYWYYETIVEAGKEALGVKEQGEMMRRDLALLFDMVDDVVGKRFEFVKQLCDVIASAIEGPQGLGKTSKRQFEHAITDILRSLKMHIDMEAFVVLQIADLARIKRRTQISAFYKEIVDGLPGNWVYGVDE